MAVFCVSCGNPLTDGAKFCTKCGATQPAAAAPVGTVMPPASATPAGKGSNTAMKIIIGIVAFFMLLILLVAGSCAYVAYRVKQKTHEFTQSMHTDEKPYTGKRQPCAMLTTSEASAALGQTVSSVEQRGTTICEYMFGANGQHFDVDYAWEGGGVAMGIAHGAMKHLGGTDASTTVDGVGDEAYLAAGNSSLMMRKGDVLVTIDLRDAGISAEAAKKMASKIADRL